VEIEEAMKAYLLTKTGLTALISTRIAPDDISDGLSLPCVVYQKTSDSKDHFLTGQSNLERPVFQFSAYATTKATARAITNQLKTALCDYHGTLSGLVIQKVELQDENASCDITGDGAGKVYVEDLDFQINYER